MYDQLTTTLYSKTAQLSPAVLDIINRTRVVGLHKVAAHITNRDEFTLRDAIQELGTKLAYEHLKNQKIASGLGSLRELHNADIVKLSSLGRMIGKGTTETWQNLMPRAMRKSPPGAPAMPHLLPGGGTASPFPSSVTPAGRPSINPKQTMRGANLRRDEMGMPAMGRLPTANG